MVMKTKIDYCYRNHSHKILQTVIEKNYFSLFNHFFYVQTFFS